MSVVFKMGNSFFGVMGVSGGARRSERWQCRAPHTLINDN